MNIQAPPFQSLQYVPAGEKEVILDLPILWVNAVAHGRLPQGGNHWCFYIRVGDDSTVCVDITPSYSVPSIVKPGGSKGIMIISLLPHLIPDYATKSMRLDVRPGSRVRDFVNLIVDQKRHQYEFNSECQGCRFWVDHQIAHVRDAGLFMDEAQIREARNAILIQYPDEVQYPLVVGEYYP